ncbi:hybrid sensor histidine kinase/response regulator [Desulfosoma sp.]|uniref:hybrid sensor histidine kinase/response regulator n=1 Tax=Desulfosoma sp. TaxID=2603217 RepID=UPI00404AD5F0
MKDPRLFEVVRRFLLRRLFFPLLACAVMTTCGLAAWRIVQLGKEHDVISWSVDNYISSFLTAADESLLLLASTLSGGDMRATRSRSVKLPMPYHRAFFIGPDAYTYTVYPQDMAEGITEDVSLPSALYFPTTREWPNYSVPYYRSDLKSVTVATSISTRLGTVVGELDLGRVQRMVEVYLQKVPHRVIWIMDRYGNLIVHPDAHMVQEQENVGHESLVARALAHPEGTKLLGRLSGTIVYGTSWRIDPWGWVVLVAYPLFPALYPVVVAASIGFCLFFGFMGVIHWRLIRRLHKVVIVPVEQLTRVVTHMAEGRSDAEDSWPDFHGTFAEVRLFAQRFREMSLAVQEREEALLLRQKDLVKIQESLARSEKRYREILESIDEAYFELDTEGVVMFHNSAFVRLLRLDPPPAHPFSLDEVVDSKTAEALRAFLRDVAEDRSTGRLQVFAFHDTQGASRTVEISAKPIRAQDRTTLGFRVMARDITEKIQAEKRAQELERVISHAQKMESLGTLASGIAHEFNNLLQPMTGYLDLLARHMEADDRKSRWITHIREAVDRSAELVRRMLTFARQDETRFEVVDINRLVEDTLDFLRRNIPRRIRLEKNLQENLPAVHADRLQMEQILINLVVNARDAIGEGEEGCIRVSTGRREAQDGVQDVILTVSDTGQGIPESIRERIFDPFFTTKEPGKGTGLGLSTVYGIVRRHGGTIRCHSELGKGTTFAITLPAHAFKEAVRVMKKDSAQVQGFEDPQPKGDMPRTILVVDDERDIREYILEALAEEGFRVLAASSGEEALSILKKNPGAVDAVILDENMPGMGGQACLAEVRRHYSHIPVIMASGDRSGSLRESSEPSENTAQLLKPYRLKDLIELLRDLGVS